MKLKMIALKPGRYGTRHLEAGEQFEIERKIARVYIAQKRAREMTNEEIPPQPKSAPKAVQTDDAANETADARADYERVVGRKPFYGWDAATLREKIAAHQAEPKSEGSGAEEGDDQGND